MALNYTGGPRPDAAYARRQQDGGTAPPAARTETARVETGLVRTSTTGSPAGAALGVSRTERDPLSSRLEIGMTPDEVRKLLGAPTEDALRKGSGFWVYPGLRVVFEGGRVTEVGF